MNKWNLSTQDTAVALEITDGQPGIVFLGQPGKKNFAERPACVRLPRRYTADQSQITARWEFERAEEGKLDGGRYAELYFRDSAGGLEARSRWEAHDGPAVTHQIRLDNKTGQPVIIFQPESLDIALGVNDPMEVFFAHKDREPAGCHTYLETLCDRYSMDIWTKPDEDDAGFIPLVMLHAAKAYGLYIGRAGNHGRIAIRGIEYHGIIAKIKAGFYDDFCTTVNPDEIFEVPMAFFGAYAGDIDECFSKIRSIYGIDQR
ncbi:MAG: hypothetical protein FWD23_01960 [Oscillospiraceae bacterium]|nr:hypothetical protein [Oscillospiraceae bacterium]